MQLVDVFRARVVDVSEKTLTLAVTGDAGKVSHADRLDSPQSAIRIMLAVSTHPSLPFASC